MEGKFVAQQDETVVMTGGSFKAEEPVTPQPETVTSQPRQNSKSESSKGRPPPPNAFDDAHCERAWASKLCQCQSENRNSFCTNCCWCYYKYMVAMRLGETPFMGLIPCATFALRIKVRTLFGIKGSLMRDFVTSLFCEPCAVCQMMRELDHIGL